MAEIELRLRMAPGNKYADMYSTIGSYCTNHGVWITEIHNDNGLGIYTVNIAGPMGVTVQARTTEVVEYMELLGYSVVSFSCRNDTSTSRFTGCTSFLKGQDADEVNTCGVNTHLPEDPIMVRRKVSISPKGEEI